MAGALGAGLLVAGGAVARHARNPGNAVKFLEYLASPQARLTFVAAGAQAIPFEAGRFDLALMLKSLHHVPLDLLDRALAEVHRVLRPGGLLYVSEPVFAGALNEVMRESYLKDCEIGLKRWNRAIERAGRPLPEAAVVVRRAAATFLPPAAVAFGLSRRPLTRKGSRMDVPRP